jgi:hypothetical protein
MATAAHIQDFDGASAPVAIEGIAQDHDIVGDKLLDAVADPDSGGAWGVLRRSSPAEAEIWPCYGTPGDSKRATRRA